MQRTPVLASDRAGADDRIVEINRAREGDMEADFLSDGEVRASRTHAHSRRCSRPNPPMPLLSSLIFPKIGPCHMSAKRPTSPGDSKRLGAARPPACDSLCCQKPVL